MFDDEGDFRRGFVEASETTGLKQRGVSRSNSHPSAQSGLGFVGLGRMGTAMAANLAATGYQVTAYVRRPDRMDKLAALGLKPTTKMTHLFDCEVVISMLPDDAAVRAVVLGRLPSGQAGGGGRAEVDLSHRVHT